MLLPANTFISQIGSVPKKIRTGSPEPCRVNPANGSRTGTFFYLGGDGQIVSQSQVFESCTPPSHKPPLSASWNTSVCTDWQKSCSCPSVAVWTVGRFRGRGWTCWSWASKKQSIPAQPHLFSRNCCVIWLMKLERCDSRRLTRNQCWIKFFFACFYMRRIPAN